MDIKITNSGGNPPLDTSASTVQNIPNVQVVGQDANQVDTGTKGDFYQTSNSKENFTEKDVKKAVDTFNKLLEDKESHVEYEIYGKFKNLSIRIVNNKTKEVVQELPPKKIIDMVNKLCELAGIFVDKKA